MTRSTDLAIRRAPVILSTAMALLIGAPSVLAESVHGTLSENAVSVKPIVNATVTVAGLVASVKGQAYHVDGVPIGPQPVVVRAPGHIPLRGTVNVAPGENVFDARLRLTSRQTVRRYYSAYNAHRFRLAYRMVHPDVRRHYSYRRYAATMKFFTTPPYLSMRIVKVKTLARWRPRYLGKTYFNVKAVTSVRRCQCGDSVSSERGVGHWVMLRGRWYDIFNWR